MIFDYVDHTPPDGSELEQMLKVNGAIFKLTPVRDLNGTNFMFSVWAQATVSTNVTFSGGNTSVTEEIKTSWTHITTPILKNASESTTNIVISVPEIAGNGCVYFYKAKLESGTRSTDWTPAPEDIEGRVGVTESQITQLANEIDLRVTSADFEATVEVLDNKITSKVEDTERNLTSVIEQTADGIMVYVVDASDRADAASSAASSAQSTASAAQSMATAAKDEIDNLQIGGRNLLLKSSYEDTNFSSFDANSLSGYGFVKSGTSTTPVIFGQIDNLSLVPNTDYIVSFVAWIDGNGSSSAKQALEVDLYPDSLPQKGYDWQNGITVTPTKYEWKLKSSLEAIKNCSLRFFNDQVITYSGNQYYQRYTIYITDIKLEAGNRATDWTPAPEDVSEDISYAQSTADDAKTTAEQTKTDFQRVVRIDIAGLHVGDNQSNGEVLIDSESVNVVMNGQRYSKFAGNYVQFGNYQMRRSTDGGLVFKIGG